MDAYFSAFEHIDDSKLMQLRDDLSIAWRAHIVTWASNQVKELKGDWVECGVWYGVLARTMCNYVDSSEPARTFWLFDTWGNPLAPDLNHPTYSNDMFESVVKRFQDCPNVQLVRGHVPEVFESASLERISFLGIDMNGYVAERETLERLYDRVVPGGIIYFDDSGWEYPGLRETVDDFFREKPEELLHFPSGNSLVIRI